MATQKAKRYCIAYGCLSNNRNVDFSFFTVPKDIERCQEWLALLDREDLLSKPNFNPSNYYVCSVHFNDSSFKKCGLKSGSLPVKISPNKSQEDPFYTDAQLKRPTTASQTSQTEPLQQSEKETQTSKYLTAQTPLAHHHNTSITPFLCYPLSYLSHLIPISSLSF
ncbi:unnamed protein product [Parnassius mnemosyne]|uniref:THAP-type domain-containing protein n=1 Tax=Parnassius mnemosyne TaxID=213953 RepID=A0AAV1KVR4_9NEOP